MPPCNCKVIFYEYSAFQQHLTYALTEVIHTGAEYLLILYAGHILEHLIVDGALGVTHLSQYAAVGAGDTFYRPYRTVGILGRGRRGYAVGRAILSGDLTVGKQPTHHIVAGHKAALAVRYGY